MHPAYRRVYFIIAVVTAALAAAQIATDLPVVVGATLALIGSVVVLWANRDVVRVAATFPEVARLPGIGRLFR